MKSLALYLRDKVPTDVFSGVELMHLLGGTANRRYALVKRSLASGELIQIRRGLYCFSKVLQRSSLNTFEIAQKIYFPSYVSMESALSQHGFIPERVYTTTSSGFKRSKEFETPIGHFSFTHIPKFSFLGVDRMEDGKTVYLMASPTRALADYIVAHKIDLNPLQLRESLRIETESWSDLSVKLMVEIAEESQSLRLRKFAKSLKRDLL